MNRTITVTGKANLSIAPDTIELYINFNVIRPSYESSRELSLVIYDYVKNVIVKNGIDAKSLKTIDYSIKTKYESYQEKDKTWKERFLGYALVHKLKVSFDIDPILLGAIVKSIDVCEVKPNISIDYSVKDTTAAKEELLVKAVDSSKSKALAMSNAAGVMLGDVLSINYSWSELHISRNADYLEDNAINYCCDSSMDFTPEDIDLTDSVTVVWAIK